MVEQEEPGRDLAGLVAPLAGRLVATGDRWEPFRLVDADGKDVGAAGAYFGHLQAAGRVEPTVRSYGMDLLRFGAVDDDASSDRDVEGLQSLGLSRAITPGWGRGLRPCGPAGRWPS
jgi:hypothetical protein